MKMLLLNTFRILPFVVCLAMIHAQITRSPLCKSKCLCRIKGNESDGVDVDCSKHPFFDMQIYTLSNWFDAANVSYAISGVNFTECNIGDLDEKFPPSNLTVLDFTYNDIRAISNSYFEHLQNMHTLILTKNKLNIIKPDVFKGLRTDGSDYPLKSLTTLKLNENNFHTLHADMFQHIANRLEILDLSYNPFKVIDVSTEVAINAIINLKELYLSDCRLTTIPEHFFHTPMHLSVLDLSGNNFQKVPKALEETHVLQTLYFNDHKISNLTSETGFPNITTLKVLHMCDNMNLNSIEAGAFSKLSGLVEVYIMNNYNLENIDPAAFTRKEEQTEIWPSLKKVDLSGNRLTTIDMHLILNWDHLDQLDLTRNPWTCDCDNQWIVDTLMPMYLKIDDKLAKEMKCAAPVEMVRKTFYTEHIANHTMRCSDLFGNRPEKDAGVLIGLLIGLLIGIPIVLFLIFAYQKNWFGLFNKGPAAFSRQFYSRTRSDEL